MNVSFYNVGFRSTQNVKFRIERGELGGGAGCLGEKEIEIALNRESRKEEFFFLIFFVQRIQAKTFPSSLLSFLPFKLNM